MTGSIPEPRQMRTKADLEAIIALAASELGHPPSTTELGRYLGVSRQRAHQLCQRLGLPTRAYLEAKSERRSAKRAARRQGHASKLNATVKRYADAVADVLASPQRRQYEIADAHGLPRARLALFLSYLELNNPHPNVRRNLDRHRIQALLDEDMTISEVARQTGASKHTVYTISRLRKVRDELVRRGCIPAERKVPKP